MKEFCKKHGLSADQFYGKENVSGPLYLSGLTAIPEGFNPTVSGSLDLSGLTAIPEGFNPTVGGSLYLSGFCSENKLRLQTDLVFFQGGAYVKADGIFALVVRKRSNVYVLRKIHSEKEFFLVTDGAFMHAHGETLRAAKEAFRFKANS